MFLGALMGVFFVLPSSGQAELSPVPTCDTVREHNQTMRQALRYSSRNGNYHASRVTSRQFDRLGSIRSCLKHTDRARYRLARGSWEKRVKAWGFHRHIDAITVYGKYSIPAYIVMRESGGNPCAANSTSTAGGYYQFLDSTWQAYGGTMYPRRHPAACAPTWEQHQVAARAWDGGRGQSHWALTA